MTVPPGRIDLDELGLEHNSLVLPARHVKYVTSML
jgi:hypothetical protein